jgi:hypothetical protein
MRQWEEEHDYEAEWVLDLLADGTFLLKGLPEGSAASPSFGGRWLLAGGDVVLLPRPSASGARPSEIRCRYLHGTVWIPWDARKIGMAELELVLPAGQGGRDPTG